MNTSSNDTNTQYQSALGVQTFLMILLAVSAGSLMATLILPGWLPNLSASLTGNDPKAFWYLSRSTAFVALSLMWLSMALGLAITNKMSRFWPGAPAAFAIHEFVSLLGLGFALFHALILLGDHYIQFSLAKILLPFSTTNFKPLMVGLGQLGFYAWLLLALSFYIRPKIGQKTWRALHYASFICYGLALYHSISTGTDTRLPWVQQYYWLSGAALLFLLIYRIIHTLSGGFKNTPARPQPAQTNTTTGNS